MRTCLLLALIASSLTVLFVFFTSSSSVPPPAEPHGNAPISVQHPAQPERRAKAHELNANERHALPRDVSAVKGLPRHKTSPHGKPSSPSASDQSVHLVGQEMSVTASETQAVGLSLLQPPDETAPGLAGVHPDDQLKYGSGGTNEWKCLLSEQTIEAERINDDYCDCKDGSDEPGTSACAKQNSRFWCRGAKLRGGGQVGAHWMYSTYVNDGICDCCDGSDEKSGCTNTCGALALRLHEEQETVRKGAEIRKSYVEKAKQLRGKHNNHIDAGPDDSFLVLGE